MRMELDYRWHRLKALLKGKRRPSVEDLHRLILRRRANLRPTKFIGITGSGGKTTAARFLHHLLGSDSTCALSTFGNTLDTISKRIRKLRKGYHYAVFEISGHRPGAIDECCTYVQPLVGMVTNVASDHLSNFKGRAELAMEKRRLVEIVPEDGLVFLNADDPAVLGMRPAARGQVFTFGQAADSDYRATDLLVSSSGALSFRCSRLEESCLIETGLFGEHFITSVLGAIACAHQLGIPLSLIAERSKTFSQTPGRCSLHHRKGAPIFICDTNKAPFETIGLAITTVIAVEHATRKTIVLGTISDKNSGSDYTRYRGAYRLSREVADRVIFFGEKASHARVDKGDIETGRVHFVSNILELRDLLRETQREGELILLKGSKKVDHLERIAIDYERPVVCWEVRCGLPDSCFDCERCHSVPAKNWHRMRHRKKQSTGRDVPESPLKNRPHV